MRGNLLRLSVVSFGCFSLALGVLPMDVASAVASTAYRAAPPAPPAPTITSVGRNVYVSAVATNYVGTPGLFKLSDSGQVTGYWYGYFSGSEINFASAGTGGTATLAITPYNVGELDLWVQAVNGSSPLSAESEFVIDTKIAPGHVATLAWWKLNARRGKRAADSTGHGHTAKLSNDASFGCGAPAAPDGFRCVMKLGGLGGQATTEPTLLPLVGNNGSFSISAWVNLSKCRSRCTALSFDATHTFGFALGYQRSCQAGGRPGPCWTLRMPVSDNAGAFVVIAISPPGSARLGRWTQLTGVYDSTHQTLTLFVNGVQRSQSGNAITWAAPAAGPMRIGDIFAGGTAHAWPGRLSNVCVFFGALEPADVALLHTGDATHPHDGCAALFAKYP
jgi:hypothetical protein